MRWLWLLLFSFSLNAQNTYTILIDQTLSQPVYPFDEGPSGMASFTAMFEADDFWVMPVSKNLDSAIANPLNKLLVLTPTIFRSYKEETVKNIHTFVSNGGRLLVFSEHDNYYNNATELNRITTEFGITTLPNAYKKGSNIDDAWVKASCPKYSLKDIVFYLPAPLKLSKSATILAKADTAVVAATSVYGKGKVVVVSDYELVWNFALEKNKSNKAFIEKIVLYFFGEMPTLHDPAIVSDITIGMRDSAQAEHYVTYAGREHFYNLDIDTYGARLPEHTTIAYYNPDRYRLAPHTNDSTVKTILYYDGSSNYMHMVADNNGQGILDALGYKATEPNINTVAKQFGLRFALQTLTDSCINYYTITLQPTGQQATCVSYIDTLESKHFTVFYTADATALDYNAPLGDDAYGANACIPISDYYQKGNHIIGLYNKYVFAIADMEVFWGIKDNAYLKSVFKKWLELR